MLKRGTIGLFICLSCFFAFAQDSSGIIPSDSQSRWCSVDVIKPRTVRTINMQPLPELLSSTTAFNQYTTSAGFASYNAKGFANSFTYSAMERIDSADNYSSIFNAYLGELLFSEMEVQQIDVGNTINAGNAGNSIMGSAEIKSPYPFLESRISISQQSGFNSKMGLYNRTSFRYAQAYGKKQNVAFNISGEFDLKREWTFDADNANNYAGGTAQVNLNKWLQDKAVAPYCATCPMTIAEHDKYVALISWLAFNPAASNFDTVVPKGYIHIPVKGYSENDLMGNYFQNAKINAGLHFKLAKQMLLSFTYRFAMFNTIVQPYFRYQLKNYTWQQPKAEIKGKDFFVRIYATFENSGNSYNFQRSGYHLIKAVDSSYISNYTSTFSNAYFNQIDTLVGVIANCATCFDGSHNQWIIDSARATACASAYQTPYPQKGNAAFDTAFNNIISKANPLQGAGLRALSKTFDVAGEYDFGFQKWMKIALGTTYKLTLIENNEWRLSKNIFHDVNLYLNASKNFWKDHFMLFGTGKFNYTTDFNPRGDYRAGIMFTMHDQYIWLSSGSGYVFPTLGQRYLVVNDYLTETLGNKLATANWYTYTSILDYQQYYNAHPADLWGATNKLQTYEVSPLKPQTTKTLELVIRNLVAKRLSITTTAYYNWVRNTQALTYLVNPNKDTVISGQTIGTTNGVVGQESGVSNIITGNYTPFVTWTNLPIKTNSWGVSFQLLYMGFHDLQVNINPYFNYNYFGHKTITVSDPAIVAFNDFNTPMHKINIGIRGDEVWRGLGFVINFRWTSGYKWETDFANGNIPAYHTLDAVIQYNIPKIYSTVSIGGNNLYNNRHNEIPGSPRIGAWYYAGWRLDIDLKRTNR